VGQPAGEADTVAADPVGRGTGSFAIVETGSDRSEVSNLTIGPVLRIAAANHPDELPRLAEEIGLFAEANALSGRDAMQLDLAVEEIVSNAIKYGFDQGDIRDGAIDISLSLKDGRLAIRVRDQGHAYNPLVQAPEPDLGANMEDRPIGGLGVHIVKAVMSDLKYTRCGNWNVLDMVLILSEPA